MSEQHQVARASKFEIFLTVCGVLGSMASGTMSLYKVMWYTVDSVDAARMYIALIYITFLTVISPSAELGLMESTDMFRFINLHVGRGFLYLLIGSLLLGPEVAPCVVGALMIVLCVLNIVAQVLYLR
uniref:COPI associated protein n=1 Tax=Trypanosoma congolense (strain IL3000) TaxID=1068625 RepID=G0URX8_TRYCI|nr:conserved hypothetical protein [Trypanosoma congolense IL3000]